LTKKKKKKKEKKNAPFDILFPNFSFELILQSKGQLLHMYPHPTVTRKNKSQLFSFNYNNNNNNNNNSGFSPKLHPFLTLVTCQFELGIRPWDHATVHATCAEHHPV
jgi:hypothetical protein